MTALNKSHIIIQILQMKAMPLKTITPKSHEENNIKVNKSINRVITQCLALVHYFNVAIFKRFLVSCIIFQPKIVGIFIYWFNFDPPKTVFCLYLVNTKE